MTNDQLTTIIYELKSRISRLEQAVFPFDDRAEPAQKAPVVSSALLDKINEALGTKFRPVHANMKYLKARLDEGATVDELVDVARLKKSEWGSDPEMRKYLRIETLYNATKFQSYLAEVDQAKERASVYDELR